MKVFSIILLLIATLPPSVKAQQTHHLTDHKVQELLAQMTLEEKVGQMTQIDFSVVSVLNGQIAENPIDLAKLEEAIVHHHVGSILNTPTTPNNQAQPIEKWRQITQAIRDLSQKTRLKIPVIYGIDAIHGATYTQGAVLFPQAISMAATFNTDLAFKACEITARICKAVSRLTMRFVTIKTVE